VIDDYITGIVLGILTRILIGFTSQTKRIGIKISDTKEGTGFQNAITPPKFNWFATIIYGLSAIFIFYSFTDNSLSTGFKYTGTYLGSIILFGAVFFMPGKKSIFDDLFFKIIFNSTANRYADYKKSNDSERAKAMKYLLDRIKKING
tara:strand:+ start:58 stop:501 length:444 start_codon:yes stop_codon:yes gene_type:complete